METFKSLDEAVSTPENAHKSYKKPSKMTTQNLTKPKGLYVVTWTRKDGTTATRYRVILQKDGIKENRLFDDEQEATEFILNFKSKLGRERIYSLTEEEKKKYDFYSSLIASQNFFMLVNKYKEDNLQAVENERYESFRIKQNHTSFLKTITNTLVNKPLPTDKVHSLYSITVHPKIKLGELKPEELTIQVIDDYIKTRRATGVKGITIERELTIFSQFIKQLKRSQQYQNINNFALEADKHLLSKYKKEDNANKQRKKAMSEDELEKFFGMLDKAQNPDVKSIVLLSFMTAMRRSEIVNLTWEQIDFDDSIIYLPMTKSGKPREVVMTNETADYLKKIQKNKSKTGKIFSYKNVAGFDGTYKKLCERYEIKINFHRMRAEAFTRFFNQLSGGSETMMAKFLGISNVSKFAQKHKPKTNTLNSEKGIIESGGHATTQETFNHYLLDIAKEK